MSRAIIFTVNDTPQSVQDGSALMPGSIRRRYGAGLDLSGNGFLVGGVGYYKITVCTTLTPTAEGTATISVSQNGTDIPGVTASETVSGANETISLYATGILRVFNNDSAVNLTFILSGVDAQVTNVAITIEKT